MSPFEEVKDEEDESKYPKIPTIGESLSSLVAGVATTVLFAGLAGVLWNHIAPSYLYFLPTVWQHINWFDAFCMLFLIRCLAMASYININLGPK